MPHYESTFIIRHDLSLNDVEKITDSFIKIITDHSGIVAKKETWGLKDFLYPIKKANKGHYIHLGITAPVAALKEMERQMSLSEDVIRHCSFRVDAIDPKPSAMLKPVHNSPAFGKFDSQTSNLDNIEEEEQNVAE